MLILSKIKKKTNSIDSLAKQLFGSEQFAEKELLIRTVNDFINLIGSQLSHLIDKDQDDKTRCVFKHETRNDWEFQKD